MKNKGAYGQHTQQYGQQQYGHQYGQQGQQQAGGNVVTGALGAMKSIFKI